ncbi:MAG: hypothetical protein UHG68_07050, partial [Clostridia bacterium]|nr:hypothetical protein [Clostridia bacterium]
RGVITQCNEKSKSDGLLQTAKPTGRGRCSPISARWLLIYTLARSRLPAKCKIHPCRIGLAGMFLQKRCRNLHATLTKKPQKAHHSS